MNVLTGLSKSTTFHSLVALVFSQLPNIAAAFGYSIAPATSSAALTVLAAVGVALGRINAAGPLTAPPKA